MSNDVTDEPLSPSELSRKGSHWLSSDVTGEAALPLQALQPGLGPRPPLIDTQTTTIITRSVISILDEALSSAVLKYRLEMPVGDRERAEQSGAEGLAQLAALPLSLAIRPPRPAPRAAQPFVELPTLLDGLAWLGVQWRGVA